MASKLCNEAKFMITKREFKIPTRTKNLLYGSYFSRMKMKTFFIFNVTMQDKLKHMSNVHMR